MRDISERSQLQREDRAFKVEPIELRDGENGWKTFEGVASTVDSSYAVQDMFGEFSETVVRGAFHRSIEQRDRVDLLYNHNRDYLLANTKNGSLQLRETPHVNVLASLNPADPDVQKIAVKMEDGRLDEMSVGFRVLQQEWNSDYTERRITEARLFDVSVVNEGQSPFTTASLRALDEAVRAMTDVEDWDEDTLRRAITHLEGLLPVLEPPVVEFDTVAAMRSLWAKRAPMPGMTMTEPADPDEDPVDLVEALDAALDAATAALDGGNPEQASALLVAAETTVDTLLALLGGVDADDAAA